MATTYTLISSQVLGSSSASVTFSSIPATYTDLVMRTSVRTDRVNVNDLMSLTFNGDTTANYSRRSLLGSGSAVSSGNDSGANSVREITVNGNSSTTNTFANCEIYISNYLVSAQKPLSIHYSTENNATAAVTAVLAYLWNNTAAITSMNFVPVTGPNFLTGSSFYLYGIKSS